MNKLYKKNTGIDITDWLVEQIGIAEENKLDCGYQIDFDKSIIEFYFENTDFNYNIEFEYFKYNETYYFKFHKEYFNSDIYDYIKFDYSRIEEVLTAIEHKF